MKRTLCFLLLVFTLSIVLTPLPAAHALPGPSKLVVGQKCPSFSYRTVTGKRITNDTFKGKAFLLDIWSTT